jgi:hypothetical protein
MPSTESSIFLRDKPDRLGFLAGAEPAYGMFYLRRCLLATGRRRWLGRRGLIWESSAMTCRGGMSVSNRIMTDREPAHNFFRYRHSTDGVELHLMPPRCIEYSTDTSRHKTRRVAKLCVSVGNIRTPVSTLAQKRLLSRYGACVWLAQAKDQSSSSPCLIRAFLSLALIDSIEYFYRLWVDRRCSLLVLWERFTHFNFEWRWSSPPTAPHKG